MKTFTIPKQFLLSLFTLLFACNGWSAVLHDFDKVNPADTYNVQGNYAIAGNTVMCLTEKTDGYGGTCHGMTDYELITSNLHVSKYIDIDDDSSTWNSTSSYITIPTSFDTPSTGGKGVLWAGLFWQGRISADSEYDLRFGYEDGSGFSYQTTSDGTYGSNFSETELLNTNADHIKLKVDSNAYQNVVADTIYTYNSSDGTTYAAFADVTSIISSEVQSDGKHVFTVANLTTDEGREPSPGVFGGWSLVVIYAENSSGKMRNISVYSGFDIIDNPSDPFTITDFILPKENTVNATLSLFSGEGEYLYGHRDGSTWAYDRIQISPDGINYDNMPVPTGIDESNIFDGKLTGITRDDINGSSNNLQINNDGVDVDTFDVSALMEGYRDANPNLTSLYIQWESNNDYITPSMLVFATELYAPKFCYDYAYKQQGVYFTEKNDGSKMPRLTGTVFPHEDIEMTIFIRNLVDSDLEVTDMNVSILDINTSQTTYIRNTTKVAAIGDLIPQPVSDSSLTVSDSFIKGIYIGTIQANEHFYVYYSLDPLISDLNGTIDVRANYNLTLNGVTIPYTLQLGQNMEICSTSNFKYAPAKGIFNIVHNNYYNHDTGGSNEYYNLPTQVTQRVGNFKVLSMDPVNLDELKETSTIVAVEMIDASAFHDTNASCMELASSISKRVWVTFDNNTTSTQFNKAALDNAILEGATKLLTSSEFYSIAKQNAAFRVSYNTTNDGNSSLIQHTYDSVNDEYMIDNFTELVQDVGTCSQAVTFPVGASSVTTTQVAVACGNAGTYISKAQYTACMECLYGINTRLVCSRDNFSIRPEAFMLNLDDQNQSAPTSQSRLTTNYSGAVGATAPVVDLAADYKYNIEINASNHINNISSLGYTRSFNTTTPNDIAEYRWEPRTSITTGACNDDDNKSLEIRFINGEVDTNTSVAQVGEYRLHLVDKTWTAVDSNPTFMTHHVSPYFFLTLDCVQNSSATQLVNAATNNGCEISTTHLNPSTNVQYNDFNVTFHPYQYSVSNNVTLRTGNVTPPTTFKPFVYMANVAQDENMSVHLNTTISAIGKNSTTPLSNYVTGCFAKPMNLEIGKTATTNTALRYSYRVHNQDINGTIVSANDINQTIAAGNTTLNPTFTTTSAYFHKNMNGTTQIVTNLNFDRDVNVTANPEDINFTTISVDDNATLFNADLTNNKYAEGNVSVNQRVLHYYGRTIAPKITVICNQKPCKTGMNATNNNNIKELISYVIYCNPSTTTCSDTLNLPSGAGQVADVRWFENRNHDKIDGGWLADGTDGTIGTITEIAATGNVNEVATRNITANKYETEALIEYSGPLPYDAIMQMQSSPWLINNDTDANATANTFIIQFVGDGGWSGKYEDNTTTHTEAAGKTNRRIMW
ncbi:hypothetical protein [Sulfurimonas indica]|uniref:hypothetical protein n=1 Tax=Sulfurimonas indica TaxID=2508707 RepID=UPI001265180E|nr:hypothetical protein [Sulfurimonas indica]